MTAVFPNGPTDEPIDTPQSFWDWVWGYIQLLWERGSIPDSDQDTSDGADQDTLDGGI